MKKVFTVKVTYFKPSGKYYTHTELTREFGATVSGIYMQDAVDYIRSMWFSPKGFLPGLSTTQWEGYIMVECDEHGYPCLILPNSDEMKE